MQRLLLIIIVVATRASAFAQSPGDTQPRLESRESKLAESMGLETVGGVFTALIRANADLGTSVSKVFSTFADNQSQITLHLCAGTKTLAADNRALGTYVITGFPPAPRGKPQVEIQFTATQDSKLAVSAKDKNDRQATPHRTPVKSLTIRLERTAGGGLLYF